MTGNDLTTLPEILVVEHQGEPRARDVDIGEKLGFERPRDIRKLIERKRAEIEKHGPLTRHRVAKVGKGRPEAGYLLNEGQALYVAAASDAPRADDVRHMLIETFMAWRHGRLLPTPEFDMKAVGGMMEGILAKQLQEVVPALVAAELASRNMMIRRGKTAGQIWAEHGFPRVRVTSWFGNRLRDMKCEIEGAGRGELGLSTARLFCPDKAAAWLRNGGRLMVERKIAERAGQGVLRLVTTA